MRYVVSGVVICGLLGGCSSRPGPAVTSAPAQQAMMTPQNLEELMKKMGPTYKSLVAQLEANDTAQSAKGAQQLAEWFGGVEKFWAQHNRDDAVKWAGQARAHASDAAGAAAAGNANKAATAANAMARACDQCHGTYRESDGAGGYRIKPGVITPPLDSTFAGPSDFGRVQRIRSASGDAECSFVSMLPRSSEVNIATSRSSMKIECFAFGFSSMMSMSSS
jgi:cytochrome c556